MAHQDQSNAFGDLVQMLAEHGFDGMARAIEILFNEAMKLERAEALGADPKLGRLDPIAALPVIRERTCV